MRKIFCRLLMILIFILSFNTSLEAATLHNPQGRIGVGYKPEKYTPYLKTNISKYELERVGQIIKQQEQEKKKAAKKELDTKTAKKDMQQQKQAVNKQQVSAKQLSTKQTEQDRIKQQKETLAAKHKAEMEKLKQEKMALAKEQQRKENEAKIIAKKEKEAKIIEEQQRKNDEYLKKQIEREKTKEEKLVSKIKQKQEAKDNINTISEQDDVVTFEQSEKEKLQQAKYDMIAEKKAEKARLKQEKIDAKNQEKEAKNLTKQESQKKTAKALFFKKIENDKNVQPEALQAADNKTENLKQANIKKLPQDPQTKKIVKEISNELSQERAEMLEELSILWVSAVQKSDTVYFAIMKLSNPNGEEVNKKGIKKILEPIISAAPLVGQAFVNPALTAGSVIGSNFMGAVMNDSATKRLTKVNDADLVILARAIDELQETLLMNYMAYKNSLKEYELAIKIAAQRKKAYDSCNNSNSPNVILAHTFYAEALDNQYKARQEFLMKRVVLEQMVGSEALNEIEQKKVEAEKANEKAKSGTK